MPSLNDLLSLLPTGLLSRLDVAYGVDAHHEIRLPGHVLFLCLLNGMLNHLELSQRLLEETYTQQTGKHADHSTFSRALARMEPAYFEAIFDALYRKVAPQPSHAKASLLRVRFVDATTVTLSAKLMKFGLFGRSSRAMEGQRHVKSVLELSTDGWPQLLHVCKEQRELNDCAALGEPVTKATRAGDLWVFDRGCHSRDHLYTIHERGGFWLTPHHQQALAVKQTVWERPTETGPSEAGEGDGVYRLLRVEQALFENTYRTNKNRRLLGMALVVLHGERWDARAKAWKPLILMTNLPLSEDATRVGEFTFEEVAALYRRRWEMETFFKFLKQHLGYSHLTSRNENGIRIMIYMSLIAALLMIWYQRQTGIDRGWRSVKFWLANELRAWTMLAIEKAFRPPPQGTLQIGQPILQH